MGPMGHRKFFEEETREYLEVRCQAGEELDAFPQLCLWDREMRRFRNLVVPFKGVSVAPLPPAQHGLTTKASCDCTVEFCMCHSARASAASRPATVLFL